MLQGNGRQDIRVSSNKCASGRSSDLFLRVPADLPGTRFQWSSRQPVGQNGTYSGGTVPELHRVPSWRFDDGKAT